jgi:rhodanese-related sulfurtransferase
MMRGGSPAGPRSVGTIDPAELRRRMDASESVVLLDVREPFERELAVIGTSSPAVDLAIPMGEIPSRYRDVTDNSGDWPIVVYCHHGQRSMVVARWLAARGISGLLNLDGGIDAWSARVDPSTPRY